MDDSNKGHPLPPLRGNGQPDGKKKGTTKQGCLTTIFLIFVAVIVISIINYSSDESADDTTTETDTTTPSGTTSEESTTLLPEYVYEASSSEEVITLEYKWSYGGSEWTWELGVDQAMYDYFKGLPCPPTSDYSVYITNPLDDSYIDGLAEEISETAVEKRYSEYQTVEFATAFVQSLPYTVDSATSPFDEYPRYPVETLVDNGGDCEDTSILLASILDSMGYGVVLIEFSEHCAVGVKGGEGISGIYWEHAGEKYFYIETTASGWGIGELPDEYSEASAYVHPMVPVPVIYHEWSTESKALWYELTVEVTNLGTAVASDIYVLAGYDNGEGQIWSPTQSEVFDLAAGYHVDVTLNLGFPPTGVHTRLLVQVVMGGYSVSESYSEWFDT